MIQMNQIDGNQILKLGKKHKKWNEDVTIEGFPYLINNNLYFFCKLSWEALKRCKEYSHNNT